MDSVGSNDEIVPANRTISEGYIDLVIFSTERCQCGAESRQLSSGVIQISLVRHTDGLS